MKKAKKRRCTDQNSLKYQNVLNSSQSVQRNPVSNTPNPQNHIHARSLFSKHIFLPGPTYTSPPRRPFSIAPSLAEQAPSCVRQLGLGNDEAAQEGPEAEEEHAEPQLLCLPHRCRTNGLPLVLVPCMTNATMSRVVPTGALFVEHPMLHARPMSRVVPTNRSSGSTPLRGGGCKPTNSASTRLASIPKTPSRRGAHVRRVRVALPWRRRSSRCSRGRCTSPPSQCCLCRVPGVLRGAVWVAGCLA